MDFSKLFLLAIYLLLVLSSQVEVQGCNPNGRQIIDFILFKGQYLYKCPCRFIRLVRNFPYTDCKPNCKS